MNEAPGPASIAALRDAVRSGREPPPAQVVARLKSYRWFVVGSVCVGAFMGQVDSSITQMLLPHLELEFQARLSTVSWVAVAYLVAMAMLIAGLSLTIWGWTLRQMEQRRRRDVNVRYDIFS